VLVDAAEVDEGVDGDEAEHPVAGVDEVHREEVAPRLEGQAALLPDAADDAEDSEQEAGEAMA